MQLHAHKRQPHQALASTAALLLVCALNGPAVAQAAVTPAVAAPTAGYHKGFFIQSPDGAWRMAIGGHLQVRLEDVEQSGADPERAMSLRRARLRFGGHLWSDSLGYKVQAAFDEGTVGLKDYYLDAGLLPGLVLRIGQFKRPYSRQQLTSGSKMEFIERAVTDEAFASGRDIGLMLHDAFESSPTWEWALGVFNGTGERPRTTLSALATAAPAGAGGSGSVGGLGALGGLASLSVTNVPKRARPAVVARVGWNQGGIAGYSEGDLEGDGDSGALRVAVGASVHVDLGLADDGPGIAEGEVDFCVKTGGFAVTGAAFAGRGLGVRDGEAKSFDTVGGHLQASRVFGGRYEIALRGADVMPIDDGDSTVEAAVAFSLYLRGHALAWQNEVATIKEGSRPLELQSRSQLQVAF